MPPRQKATTNVRKSQTKLNFGTLQVSINNLKNQDKLKIPAKYNQKDFTRRSQSQPKQPKSIINYSDKRGMVYLNRDFKVDNFWASFPEEFTFFLSHNHEDHLTGLNKGGNYGGGAAMMPRLDWNFGKIYTSEVSAKILLFRFPHLEKYVVKLELYTPYNIKGRSVTLIEANHCPGSVMFLFQGPSGTVLHTGDFRFRPKMLDQINKFAGSEGIDFVHMDNTFATNGESFPNQSVVFTDIVKLIEKSLLNFTPEVQQTKSNIKKDPKPLNIHLYSYTLGKEEIFDGLARHFKTKVQVMKDRWTKMNSSGMLMDLFVHKQMISQDKAKYDGKVFIYVKNMRDRPQSIEQIEKKNNIVHIVLTGWKAEYNLDHPRYFKKPYSSHSSPTELEEFLKVIQPQAVFFNMNDEKKLNQARADFQFRLVSKYTKGGKDFKSTFLGQATSSQAKLLFNDSGKTEKKEDNKILFREIDDVLADKKPLIDSPLPTHSVYSVKSSISGESITEYKNDVVSLKQPFKIKRAFPFEISREEKLFVPLEKNEKKKKLTEGQFNFTQKSSYTTVATQAETQQVIIDVDKSEDKSITPEKADKTVLTLSDLTEEEAN